MSEFNVVQVLDLGSSVVGVFTTQAHAERMMEKTQRLYPERDYVVVERVSDE